MSRWLTGLIILQLGLIGLMVCGRMEGALSIADLASLLNGSHLNHGDSFPPIILYDQRSERINFSTFKRSTTFIFASCPCESERVYKWSIAARNRGDRVAVILFHMPINHVLDWKKYVPSSTELYSYQGQRLYNFFNLGAGKFPKQVIVLKSGIISEIDG